MSQILVVTLGRYLAAQLQFLHSDYNIVVQKTVYHIAKNK